MSGGHQAKRYERASWRVNRPGGLGKMKTATRKFSNEYRFNTPPEIVTFAHTFIKQRVTGFTKDIDICLTPNTRGQSAYLPGLMACISFLDLLTGLYVGRLDTVKRKSLDDLQAFAANFLRPQEISAGKDHHLLPGLSPQVGTPRAPTRGLRHRLEVKGVSRFVAAAHRLECY
jgi:hypothetical protein